VDTIEAVRGLPRVVSVGGACQIFLVRHGTTTMNKENRYRGRRDVPLDAQGYQDAVDAARFLSQRGLSAVYTGPLRRTIATAQIIADEAGVPDIRILHGLNNLEYGAWEGMTADEAQLYDPDSFHQYRQDPLQCVCPNGERLSQARDRLLESLRLIGGRHGGEAVAAVTHAVMIRLMLTSVRALPGELWRVPLGRGSITEVLMEDGRLTVAPTPAFSGSADGPGAEDAIAPRRDPAGAGSSSA
jgi:broad specificity phosphatase PhoE